LWRYLTDPFYPTPNKEHQQYIQLVAAISGSVFVVIFPLLFIVSRLPALQSREHFPLIWLLCGTFLLPYFIARFGYPRQAVLLHSLLAALTIYVAALLLSGSVALLILCYLVLVYIYAATFLPILMVTLIAAICIFPMALLPDRLGVNPALIAIVPFSFNVIGAVYSIAIIAYWRRRETRKQQQLSQSEERYRVISEMTSDYMFFVRCDSSTERKLEWVTESVERFLGYSVREVLQKTDANIHPDDIGRALEARRRVLMGQPQEEEYRFFRKDGQMRWVLVNTRPAYQDGTGEIIGYYGAVRDITDRKSAEEEQAKHLVQQQQFRLVDRFVAAMSHDFRNRLATIESSRYIIEKLTQNIVNEKLTSRMVTIQDATTKMLEQLDNLLIITSVNDPQPEPIELVSAVSSLVNRLRLVATQGGCTIAIVNEHEEQMLWINIDRSQLETVLKELVKNAISHAQTSTVIIIRLKRQETHAAIEVEDKGRGIPEADLPYIFEAFYKVDEARTITHSGVGLGLTIVKMIADAHNGKVQVESTPGQGCIFRFMIPLCETRHSPPM
jgi:PAS domain S-box-containing protein